MREIKNIDGFVVNMYDATNYDIDLDLPLQLHEKYSSVISSQYSYRLFPDINFDPKKVNDVPISIGTTYRCRLKGISLSHEINPENMKIINAISYDIKNLIDITDGAVVCNLRDIDIYQRLLVDIYLLIENRWINIAEYILDRMKDLDKPPFTMYNPGKK